MRRREFVTSTGAAIAFAFFVPGHKAFGGTKMFGLIGKIMAAEGKREDLVKTLLEGTGDMPGCLSYIVAKDTGDANAIWITEVWDSKENHQASLKLPQVQEAISKARPMIAGFGERFETEPVGGQGFTTK